MSYPELLASTPGPLPGLWVLSQPVALPSPRPPRFTPMTLESPLMTHHPTHAGTRSHGFYQDRLRTGLVSRDIDAVEFGPWTEHKTVRLGEDRKGT